MEHWDAMVGRSARRSASTPRPGLPLPATLRELDLEELIPVVERIQAERGMAAAR